MRHALANLLYSLGSAMDAPSRAAGCKNEFGDKRRFDGAGDTITFQFHVRDETPIRGRYDGGSFFTYAALTVGDTQDCTLFLTRQSTLKLLDVLGGISDGFRKYGENR